jgi:hypothetical protein
LTRQPGGAVAGLLDFSKIRAMRIVRIKIREQ